MQHNSSLTNLSATFAKVFALVLLLLFLSGPLPLHAEWSLLDGVKVHPDYHGPVPQKSDVIFSTRFKRDNAPEVAKSFGATRIEWVYSTDPEFVQSLKSVTPWFGGTLNSTMPLPKDEGIARDFDGNPIVAPWMKSWGAKWITTTDPRAREVLKGIARQYLALGASSIQVDDPLLQLKSADWGGDFSESSVAGFREFLATYPDQAELQQLGIVNLNNFDYKKFLADRHNIRTAKEYQDKFRSLATTPLWLMYLKESVIVHFANFRGFLNGIKGGLVPVSMNLLLYGPDENRPEFSLSAIADYAMVETKINDLDLVSLQAATYRALGMGYAPSIQPLSKFANRMAIATLYALGAQPVVPWDVYINEGPDKKPSRFFGLPEDYGDLYRFVRENAVYFDNYEELAVVGIVVPVDHYQIKQVATLVRRLSKARVPYAIVPIGGKRKNYSIDANRVSRFRLLLTVNQMSDLSPEDISSLHRLPVKFMSAEDISDQMITALSPYASTLSAARLIARGSEQGRDVVIHIIRAIEGGSESAPQQCEKAIALRGGMISLDAESSFTWHTPKRIQKLTPRVIGSGVSLDLPDCEEWGFLAISPT